MATYVVSYDLHDAESSAYNNFTGILKSLGGKPITESTWLIESDGTAEGIKDSLHPFLPAGSRLYVGKLDPDPSNHAVINPLN